MITILNLQNIPSHNTDIRKMFVATQDEHEVSTENDIFEVDTISDVLTPDGYVNVKDIQVGDTICNSTERYIVKNIIRKESVIELYV